MESFGSTLRIERQKKKLSIDQVSNHLKISKTILRAIEDEDNDSLPSPVYVKGFIRSYSSLLSLESDPLINSFNVFLSEEMEPFQQPINREVPEEKKIESPSFVKFSNQTFPLLMLCVLGGVIGVVYFFTPNLLNSKLSSKSKSEVKNTKPNVVKQNTSNNISSNLGLSLAPSKLTAKTISTPEEKTNENPVEIKTEPKNYKTQYIGLQNLSVSIKGIESTKFSVEMDKDSKSKDYNLESGKVITLSAQNKMIFSFSNPAEVEIKYGKYGYRNLEKKLNSNRLYFTKAL